MILTNLNKQTLLSIESARDEIKKHVLCSYKWAQELTNRYPKRSVMPDRNCPSDEMYYWNKNGEMRTVYLDVGQVWKSEYAPCELLDGMMAPTGYIVRIR